MAPNQALELLVDGTEAYPAMLSAIAAARHELLLETYTFRGDQTGERFVEALVERARAGVSVRVLIDGVGSFGFPERLRQVFATAGVKLAEFRPLAPWRPRWGWWSRDHRKLLVVDGRIGFLGGLNIGNEYAPRQWGGGAWHDLHLQVRGTVATDLRQRFFRVWRHTPAGAMDQPPPLVVPDLGPDGSSTARVLAVGRLRGRRTIRRAYRFAVRNAQRTVRIQAAYFVPDLGWRRVLANAARRGVDVRLMLPAVSDVPIVQFASRATYASLLRHGVRIFEWLPSMLHAKAMVIDGNWWSVGSYNLDRRSLLHNWELALAAVEPTIGARLEKQFEDDLSQCREILASEWATRPAVQRLLEWSSFALRRWF